MSGIPERGHTPPSLVRRLGVDFGRLRVLLTSRMSWPQPLFVAACGRRCPAHLALILVLLTSTAGWAERALTIQPPADMERRTSNVDSWGVSRHSAVRFQQCTARRVSRDELRRAMAQHGDYDILATTNRGRFSSELLLRLGRQAREQDPEGGPLYIEPDDWFHAFIETAGVSEDEAPLPARLGFENRQRVLIEYRRHRVIDEVAEGPEPTLALNIRAWWQEAENPASSFSFTDTTASPKLKVTSHREITYRLLEFDDMIVVDEMDGITGRPVSGLLGTIFDYIGEASVKHSRIAVSDDDGVQITRARSKKVFSISVTVTVEPDGRARKGLPRDRPDLQRIEERLKNPLKTEYVPYEWEPVCPGNTSPAANR